uniref:Uncharacterized protein n=1 Tax=Strongyloides stercoralis TaxID=6248 RepID=A0AAF5CXT2_STRER
MKVMKSGNNISFMDLMEISLVRREILQKLPTFHDISNLAKTSKDMNFLICREKIKKGMLRYFDEQHILIKIEDPSNTLNLKNLNKIEFLKDDDFSKEFENVQNFDGETIIFKNEVDLEIFNTIKYLDKSSINSFVKKLINEANVNCHPRGNVTNLKIKVCDNSFDQNFPSFLLYMISFMNHDNIKQIKIPAVTFTSDFEMYDNLKSNIFEGFPKFNELVISVLHIQTEFTKLVRNKSIFEKILKELSRRENATLTLECFTDESNVFIKFAHMIQKIAANYQIKVKCDVSHIIPLIEENCSLLCSNEKSILHPIEKIITSFFNYIQSFPMFLVAIRNLQYFTNLEKIEIRISLLNIKNEIKKIDSFDVNILSLKECKKLKQIKIEFIRYYKSPGDMDTNIIYEDLEFIASIMPKSVERLELWNIPKLSNDVIRRLNKCLPNIKVLAIWEVTFKDLDCLNLFQSLKAFICYQNIHIKIPDTIELLAIGSTGYLNDYVSGRNISQELIKSYTERFSKCVQSSQGRYIFFNDIKQWEKYKQLFQNNYYFFC